MGEKEKQPALAKENRRPPPERQDSSSPSADATGSSRMAATPRESPSHQVSSWQQSWSTSAVRFSSSPATLPPKPRRRPLFPVTCSSPSETMKSSASYCAPPPSPKVVSFPTCRKLSGPRKARRPQALKRCELTSWLVQSQLSDDLS